MKKPLPKVFVRILQNGYPVAETETLLSFRRTKLQLTANNGGELAIPLYPFSEDLQIIRMAGRKMHLVIDQPWSGYLSSKGSTQKLGANDRSFREFPMLAGDVANLVLNDLRLMIRVVNPTVTREVALDSAYAGSLFGLFFRNASEKKGLFLAAAFSLVLFCGIFGTFQVVSIHRPSKFEDLEASYTLPFIDGRSIDTAPEGLQSDLNRQKYVESVVAYYRNFTKMIMGWPLDKQNLMFISSVKSYRQKYEEQRASLERNIDSQQAIDTQMRRKIEKATITIPSVYGSSFRAKLVNVIEKIEDLHNGFDLSLKHKKAVVDKFRKDPIYDWEDYHKKAMEVKPAGAEKVESYAEKSLYREAKDLANHARALQAAKEYRAEKRPVLDAANLTSVFLPSNVSWASFINSMSEDYYLQSDKKQSLIVASKFDEIRKEKIREPLIGKIKPYKIEEVIKNNQFALNLCYELALRRNQTLEGKMQWSWRIDSRGKISDLALEKSNLKDAEMVHCVRNSIASWPFPRPKNGSISIQHIFSFKPRSA
jgi:hypothetical protein